VYTPAAVTRWRAQIAAAARHQVAQHAGYPIQAGRPVSVRLLFCLARPKSHYHRGGKRRLDAPTMHTTKPDTDNLAKAALDALTTAGLWHDDAQVCMLTIDKRFAECCPGLIITVSEI
jgi:Holliday junction resolvase RusA-like endonuclease